MLSRLLNQDIRLVGRIANQYTLPVSSLTLGLQLGTNKADNFDEVDNSFRI